MKKICIIIGLLLTMLPLGAQTLKPVSGAESQTMIKKINQAAAAVRTLNCQFTQVKTLRFLNDKMTSEGRMLFDAAGKLRWEYTTPYQYTFIINGDKVYINSAKSSQTIDIRQSQLFRGIAEVMMSSVTGKCLMNSSDFTCQLFVAGDEWVAQLTPRKRAMKKLFEHIHLHFSSSRQIVTQVVMTEPGGDHTVITLKGIKANGPVDQKMFTAK